MRSQIQDFFKGPFFCRLVFSRPGRGLRETNLVTVQQNHFANLIWDRSDIDSGITCYAIHMEHHFHEKTRDQANIMDCEKINFAHRCHSHILIFITCPETCIV